MMIPIDKNIFEDYFRIQYNILKSLHEHNFKLDDLIEKQNIELNKIKDEIKKILKANFDLKDYDKKNTFSQLCVIYNENDDGGYHIRDEYKSKIIKTDSLPKLYYYLLFEILDGELFNVWMNKYEDKKKNDYNNFYAFNRNITNITYIIPNYKCILEKSIIIYSIARTTKDSDELNTKAKEAFDIIYKYDKTEEEINYLKSHLTNYEKIKRHVTFENNCYDLLELLIFFFNQKNIKIIETDIIEL